MSRPLKRAQQQRQRRSIAAMNRQRIDAHLQDLGVNLPKAVLSVKTTTPCLLGEVIQRSSDK